MSKGDKGNVSGDNNKEPAEQSIRWTPSESAIYGIFLSAATAPIFEPMRAKSSIININGKAPDGLIPKNLFKVTGIAGILGIAGKMSRQVITINGQPMLEENGCSQAQAENITSIAVGLNEGVVKQFAKYTKSMALGQPVPASFKDASKGFLPVLLTCALSTKVFLGSYDKIKGHLLDGQERPMTDIEMAKVSAGVSVIMAGFYPLVMRLNDKAQFSSDGYKTLLVNEAKVLMENPLRSHNRHAVLVSVLSSVTGATFTAMGRGDWQPKTGESMSR